MAPVDHNHDTTHIQLFSAGLNMSQATGENTGECFMRTSLGCWVPLDAQVLCQTLGQKACHGQTVAILRKQDTAKSRGYLPADAPGLRGYTFRSPHWPQRRGWESTCLQSTPRCFSGSGRWHFCKNKERREREMINVEGKCGRWVRVTNIC